MHAILTDADIVELLGPNFQQKFAFLGRSKGFGVEILLIMFCLKNDTATIFDRCKTVSTQPTKLQTA